MTDTRTTEQRNPRTRGLDSKSTLEILRAIHREDAAVAKAWPAHCRRLRGLWMRLRTRFKRADGFSTWAREPADVSPRSMPRKFRRRLARRRAGSGRDCGRPARADARGGRRGRQSRAGRTRSRGDGLSAPKTSSSESPPADQRPTCLGALEFAQSRGAVTIGITSNPRTPITRIAKISIVTPTGPEVITGSTRMKAGTAQKMVLNMLSTAAMIRMGRVYDNWMIGVALTNSKLQARGLRILTEASGATVAECDTRPASIRTQDGRRTHHVKDRRKRA